MRATAVVIVPSGASGFERCHDSLKAIVSVGDSRQLNLPQFSHPCAGVNRKWDSEWRAGIHTVRCLQVNTLLPLFFSRLVVVKWRCGLALVASLTPVSELRQKRM